VTKASRRCLNRQRRCPAGSPLAADQRCPPRPSRPWPEPRGRCRMTPPKAPPRSSPTPSRGTSTTGAPAAPHPAPASWKPRMGCERGGTCKRLAWTCQRPPSPPPPGPHRHTEEGSPGRAGPGQRRGKLWERDASVCGQWVYGGVRGKNLPLEPVTRAQRSRGSSKASDSKKRSLASLTCRDYFLRRRIWKVTWK
jgi:hypothetical protein